jgi:hypothetical protein
LEGVIAASYPNEGIVDGVGGVSRRNVKDTSCFCGCLAQLVLVIN